MPPKNEESEWLRRLQVLRRADFQPIADELNRRRLAELNNTLADLRGTPARGQRNHRLAKLMEREGWPLRSLPSDLRADAARMKKTARAVHSLIGNSRAKELSDGQVAKEMVAHERTARRGLQDLRDACLLLVVERNRAPVNGGGRCENGYQLMWPNLEDLQQRPPEASLFDQSLPAEPTQRDRQEAPRFGHSGEPPGHSGEPPGHSGEPPGHSGHDRTMYPRAPSLSFHLQEPSSSSGKEGEGFEFLQQGEWESAYLRLSGYPVADARRALRSARQRGWSAADIVSFVAECEGMAIDGHRAWTAGQVWWQVMHGPLGGQITMQPSEDYRRAKRDRDQRLARARAAPQQVAEQSQRGNRLQELEARFGPQWDAMSPEEQAALERSALGRKFARQPLTDEQRKKFRAILLAALERRQQLAASPSTLDSQPSTERSP